MFTAAVLAGATRTDACHGVLATHGHARETPAPVLHIL